MYYQYSYVYDSHLSIKCHQAITDHIINHLENCKISKEKKITCNLSMLTCPCKLLSLVIISYELEAMCLKEKMD